MVDKTKLPQLPKLPRGMGSYSYTNEGKVRFRKQITENKIVLKLDVTGATISEANKLMEIEEQNERKKARLSIAFEKTKTFEMQMKEWLKKYKLDSKAIKAESYDRLESTFRNHIEGTDLGHSLPDKITTNMIQGHLNSLRNQRDGQELSYSSKKKVYELLNAYFNDVYATVPYLNPMVRVVKPKKDKKALKNDDMVIFNDSEIEALEKVAYEPYIPGKSGFKHGLGIMVILWCFLREGEALALTWDDIDFKHGKISVQKAFYRVKERDEVTGELLEGQKREIGAPKYDSKRTFKLPQPALDCLIEYRKRNPEDEYLFDNGKGEAISESTLIRSYQEMKKRAGLEKQVTLHGLRHTGISYYLRYKVPVEVISKNAGHKSIQITYDTYYSVLEEHKDSAIDEFNEAYKKRKEEKERKKYKSSSHKSEHNKSNHKSSHHRTSHSHRHSHGDNHRS